MKGRVTKAKLLKWFAEKFRQLEIESYEVYDIVRTRYTGSQYEGGAAKLNIHFRSKTDANPLTSHGYFLCFYSMEELTDLIERGYTLYIKSDPWNVSLHNFELEVRK